MNARGRTIGRTRGNRSAGWRRSLHALLALLPLACMAAPAAVAPSGEDSPIADAAEQALWWGDFDRLEAQYAAVRKSTELVDGGTLRLQWFRVGIARIFTNSDGHDPYFAQLEALTRSWATEHPDSALAQLLYARALFARAIAFRGSDYTSKVPPASMREFRHYLQLAESQLVEHAEVLRDESSADCYMAMFGRWDGWPFERLHSIALDSLQKNMVDSGAFEELAQAALPKWGGSAERFDDVVREARRRIDPDAGMAMYAFLYDAFADQFDGLLFKATRVDWPTMRQGFRDSLGRYPNAYLLNRFALQACLAQDKATTLEILDRIGTHPATTAWRNNFEACRRWAGSP